MQTKSKENEKKTHRGSKMVGNLQMTPLPKTLGVMQIQEGLLSERVLSNSKVVSTRIPTPI